MVDEKLKKDIEREVSKGGLLNYRVTFKPNLNLALKFAFIGLIFLYIALLAFKAIIFEKDIVDTILFRMDTNLKNSFLTFIGLMVGGSCLASPLTKSILAVTLSYDGIYGPRFPLPFFPGKFGLKRFVPWRLVDRVVFYRLFTMSFWVIYAKDDRMLLTIHKDLVSPEEFDYTLSKFAPKESPLQTLRLSTNKQV